MTHLIGESIFCKGGENILARWGVSTGLPDHNVNHLRRKNKIYSNYD